MPDSQPVPKAGVDERGALAQTLLQERFQTRLQERCKLDSSLPKLIHVTVSQGLLLFSMTLLLKGPAVVFAAILSSSVTTTCQVGVCCGCFFPKRGAAVLRHVREFSPDKMFHIFGPGGEKTASTQHPSAPAPCILGITCMHQRSPSKNKPVTKCGEVQLEALAFNYSEMSCLVNNAAQSKPMTYLSVFLMCYLKLFFYYIGCKVRYPQKRAQT